MICVLSRQVRKAKAQAKGEYFVDLVDQTAKAKNDALDEFLAKHGLFNIS